ncbi:MAG TPA: GxxExxY protein [Candidatus Ozemobacteraceae bacterium]|nr:GxxExxY protein [Candidatus Ozemobacteraceae bacterium]
MTGSSIVLPSGGLEGLEHQLLICALEVQKNLGQTVPENACRDCFAFELEKRNIPFTARVELLNHSGSEPLPSGYRVDFVVAGQVIVEVRCRPSLPHNLTDQYRSYLRLSGLSAAVIINLQAAPPQLLTRITR